MNAPAPDTRHSVFGARAFEPARVCRPDAAGRAYAADDHAGCLIRYDVASPLLEGRKRVGHFEAHYTHTRSVLVEPGMAK